MRNLVLISFSISYINPDFLECPPNLPLSIWGCVLANEKMESTHAQGVTTGSWRETATPLAAVSGISTVMLRTSVNRFYTLHWAIFINKYFDQLANS